MADNLEKKTEAAAKPHKKVDARLIGDLAPIVGLILVIVIFAVLTKGALLSKNNLQSLASSVITTAMCAIGAVFVFGAGYFDMSIGGSLCVAAVLGCKAMIATGSFFVGFLVILAVSLALAYLKAMLAAYGRLEPYFLPYDAAEMARRREEALGEGDAAREAHGGGAGALGALGRLRPEAVA